MPPTQEPDTEQRFREICGGFVGLANHLRALGKTLNVVLYVLLIDSAVLLWWLFRHW